MNEPLRNLLSRKITDIYESPSPGLQPSGVLVSEAVPLVGEIRFTSIVHGRTKSLPILSLTMVPLYRLGSN